MVQRKVKTTPLQREILSALAENDIESLINIIVRLQDAFPKLTSEEILNETERSIGILQRMGCLYIGCRIGSEIKLITCNVADSLVLNDIFEFHEQKGFWQVNASDDFQGELILRLTQGGVRILELIAHHYSTPVWKPRGT